MEAVLELRNLRTEFDTRHGVVAAVDDVSYAVGAGEILGIVGESGCGKSVSSLSVLRLIPNPPGRIAQGEILFDGEDLTRVSDARMRAIRGNQISMIFQEPMTSLNPMMTVGRQISEPLNRHQGLSKKAAEKRTLESLELVHIPDAHKWLRGFPHEMSGGMRQRVMIAMALACDPQVLIADEPTTALDVTIQAQILRLIRELRDKTRAAVLMITHDLGVIAEMADRVIVMYAGKKVEEAEVSDLFTRPRHPYTKGLIDAVPHLERIVEGSAAGSRLKEIPGVVPPLHDLPVGCAFSTRCSQATERCRIERPALEQKAPGHWAACFVEPA